MTALIRPVLVVFTALLLQLALFSELRIDGRAPDLLLVCALAAGLTGGPNRGALVGFFCGLALDLFLPTPFALSVLAYSVAGWVVGHTENASVGEHPWIAMPLGVGGSALGLGLFVTVGELLGQANLYTERFLGTLIVASIYNGVLTWPVARLFRFVWTPNLDERYPRDRAHGPVVN